MAKKQIDIGIDLAAKQAAKDADALAKSLEGVEEQFGETESAGKKMAQLLTQQADEIEAEYAELRAGADALGAALGPELANKIGQNRLDKMVADLKAAGLTADDVRADADELADAIRRLDTVGDQLQGPTDGLRRVEAGFDDVDAASKRVGTTTDNTRSVVANFTGNTASELPGVTGAFGPLNMAIGQFGEYAAEGNINLKNLILAGGGMVLVTGAVAGLNKQLDQVAATKAFNKEQMEGFVELLAETRDVAGGLAAKLKEAGKVEFTLLGDSSDATEELSALGLSVREFADLVAGGNPKIEEFESKMEAAGFSGRDLDTVLYAARQQVDNLAKAHETAAIRASVFGKAVDEAGASTRNLKAEMEGGISTAEVAAQAAHALAEQTDAEAAAADNARQEARDHTAALEAQRDATDDLNAAKAALVGGDIAVRESQRQAASAVAELNTLTEEGKQETEEYKVAQDGAASSMLAAAQAAADQAVAQAESTGATVSAATENEIYKGKLEQLASTLAPGSALRAQLQGYIDELNSIPTDVGTQLRLNLRVTGATVTRDGDLIVGPGGASGNGPPGQSHTGGPIWPGRNPNVQSGEVFVRDGPMSEAGRVYPRSQVGDPGSAGPTFITQINAPVYGVDHLNRILDERDRKLAQQLRAGRR
jgi:chromosome segregation ATPase